MYDPDQLSTKLLRLLQAGPEERMDGTFVQSDDESVLNELVSEGLGDSVSEKEGVFEARLNGNGINMLKAI